MNVSIVIPSYNRPALLERLLRSIEAQRYRDFEVIVVDNASPAGEAYDAIAADYSRRLPEFRMLRLSENRGAPAARNEGIKAARHDLIALVDDDDEWLPGKLEKQAAVFAASHSGVGLVYTWADRVDESGLVTGKYRSVIEGPALGQLLRSCFIPSPSVMVRREAIMAAGLFDERLPSCQDWDMWVRIVALGYELRVVKSVEVLYHQHPGDTIGKSPHAWKGYPLFFLKHSRLAVRKRPSLLLYYGMQTALLIIKKICKI